MEERFISDCDCYLPPVREIAQHLPAEADIFGPLSRVAADPAAGLTPRIVESFSLIHNYPYEILVILVLILFCFILYSYRGSIVLLFTVLVLKKASTDKLMEEKTQFFRSFSILSYVLGGLLVGGVLIRTADWFGLASQLDPGVLPLVARWGVVFTVTATVLVMGYKIVMIRLLGFLTEKKAFFSGHTALSRLFSIAGFLLVTPVFLLGALHDGPLAGIVIWVITGMAAVLYLLFLQKSYNFFMQRNVSILQWFLYLCAVELFPVSFFVLLALRHV